MEVVSVLPGTPAEQAGVRPEDLIVEVNGARVTGVDDLQRLMVADLIGRTVSLRVLRAGRELELELTPAELELG